MSVALILSLLALALVLMDSLPGLSSPAAAARDEDLLRLRFGDPQAGTSPTAAREGQLEGLDYHVVRSGETLSSIAALRLGDASLATRLAELNRLQDPDRLQAGQVLWLR